jgi:hypothetical protein
MNAEQALFFHQQGKRLGFVHMLLYQRILQNAAFFLALSARAP